jgi:hypothetical protein
MCSAMFFMVATSFTSNSVVHAIAVSSAVSPRPITQRSRAVAKTPSPDPRVADQGKILVDIQATLTRIEATQAAQGATQAAQGATQAAQGATQAAQGATLTSIEATQAAQGATLTSIEATQAAQGATLTSTKNWVVSTGVSLPFAPLTASILINAYSVGKHIITTEEWILIAGETTAVVLAIFAAIQLVLQQGQKTP